MSVGAGDLQRRRQHENYVHFGREQGWWPHPDGVDICSTCHPQPPPESVTPEADADDAFVARVASALSITPETKEIEMKRTAPTALEFHPAADLFPLMPEDSDDFRLLVEDIKKYGLREPIDLLDGKVLDGRNRYRACLAAGVAPKVRDAVSVKGAAKDPISYVLSMNWHRRHLTPAQRDEVLRKLHAQGRSTRQIAEEAQVSQSTVARAVRTPSQVSHFDSPELSDLPSNPGVEKGFPLDFISPVRHAATELEKAREAGQGITIEQVAADYRHYNPSDLSRIRRAYQLPTDHAATLFLIRRAVYALGNQVKQEVDPLAGHLYQLREPFSKLLYEGKTLTRYDISEPVESEPARVTGRDGKSYAATKPMAERAVEAGQRQQERSTPNLDKIREEAKRSLARKALLRAVSKPADDALSQLRTEAARPTPIAHEVLLHADLTLAQVGHELGKLLDRELRAIPAATRESHRQTLRQRVEDLEEFIERLMAVDDEAQAP